MPREEAVTVQEAPTLTTGTTAFDAVPQPCAHDDMTSGGTAVSLPSKDRAKHE
jgi:hypothetical protein